jgi:TonB family protein
MSPLVKTCLRLALFSALILATTGQVVLAQQTSADAKEPGPSVTGLNNLSQAQIDDIIRKFTAKETEFRQALNSYAFKRDALVQTLGMGGQVTGEYHRVSDFTFDDKGARYEKINFFPMPSFPGVTTEDLEDLGGVNPFALETSNINQYNFKYVGKERIDELDLYVFDVAPKIAPKKTFPRFFLGRIWVDDRDLQIVKSKGKGIPETKINKFPVVETFREQIDGKYWFPTYSYADDDLIYDNGQDLRIRLRVKYTDFKVGRGTVTITEVEEAKPGSIKPETEKPESKPTPSPTSPATQPVIGGESDITKPVEGGILNSKALELPAPKYPEAAKKAHAFGQVQVKVVVDETGRVISAEALFGPESLRQAAVEAARLARFAPTVVEGITVKVSGILTYDFKAQ